MRRTVGQLAELIGDSAGVVAVRTQAEQLLRRNSTTHRLPSVLILGETGTGKGLLARAIHEAGPRAEGPFIAINCAAIPEALLEAELFGYEQGAFTDARHAKAGLFQTAHRGTLFLDEIGLLPENLQVKLLTVLEDRAVRRLGSIRTEVVDVWIITATSEDLEAGTRRHKFREELYHRLAVVTLRLPPLRERGRDILTLAEHFLTRTCAEYGLPPKPLADEAKAALLTYGWPGNVRELANVMERVALLTDGPVVTAASLELRVPAPRLASPRRDSAPNVPRLAEPKSLEEAVEEAERTRIHEALRETRGNISHAAARLGVTRNTLRYRLQKYKLRPSALTERATPPEVGVSVESTPAPPTTSVQWDRRHVALLRADLVTAASVAGAPDAAGLLQTILDKIQSFGGQIEEISPDRVVAGFGLEPFEDTPRRAAHAALAIQNIVAHAHYGASESYGICVGLHVAEALIAQLAGTVRLEHESKREMCSQLDAVMASAQPGLVVVSEATRPFLDRRFAVAPLATRDTPEGKACRLAGLARTPLGLGERLTPLVARDRELAQLVEALERVEQGHGRLIGVVGDAGVGKSRLVWEFIESQRIRGALILVSGAASYAKATPYSLVSEMLRLYFQIEPHDDMANVRARVMRRIPTPPPALLALLDLPVDETEWSLLDPSQKRQRTLEAIKRLVVEESRCRPVVLVFEDLHWIDCETRAVIDTLVDSLASHRVLVLATYRPEYQHTWSNKSCYDQIRVEPLSAQHARVFVDRLLGDDVATAALKTMLIDRTGGNPFFLEEIVRAAVETGALAGDRGNYRLVRATSDLQLPATVQAVLEGRIGRLSPDDKALLQTAAVIGADVPLALLRAVAGVADEPLRAALARLQASEFLCETSVVPDTEYAFKHALGHEACYAGIVDDRRRALHARTMAAIERLYADRLGEHVDRLGDHALRGQIWDKAVAYSRQAGAKAAGRSAYREAVAWFEHALAALRHLPETPATLEIDIDLRLDLRTWLTPLGELQQGFEHLCKAEALAARIGDQRRQGWISVFMTHHFWLSSDLDRAVEVGRRALTIAEVRADFAMQVVTNLRLGQAYLALGDYRRARETFQKNIEVLSGDLVHERFGEAGLVSVLSRVWLLQALTEQGEFAQGIVRGEEAIRIAELSNHPFSLVGACRGLGYLYLRKGDLKHGVSILERSHELCRTWNIPTWYFGVAAFLGYGYVVSGRVAEGVALLERMIEQSIEMGHRNAYARPVVQLSEGYCLANRHDEAIRLARQALEFDRLHNREADQAWALRTLGEIVSHRDPLDAQEAETSYRQALVLAEALGMRPLVAHCHLGLGELYGRLDRRHESRQHVATAVAMYRAMDMQSWVEQAEVTFGRF